MRESGGQVPQTGLGAVAAVVGVEPTERQRLAYARWEFTEAIRLSRERIGQAESRALAAGVPADDLAVIRSEQGVPS